LQLEKMSILTVEIEVQLLKIINELKSLNKFFSERFRQGDLFVDMADNGIPIVADDLDGDRLW